MEFINKKIIVFCSDGISVSKKVGVCTHYSEDIILDNKIVIPKSRVVRIELGGDY